MISVIIPSYNQAEYLPDAIESALNQSTPRFWDKDLKAYEIIVVDDGSTDDSLEVAKSYEPDIKVISQVNKGLASARNTGIMNADGDYILPLDADDILLDMCLERTFEAIRETKADIIGLSFKTFGTTSQEIILMPRFTLEDLKTGNRLGYCSAIKREALLEIGGYSPRMTWGYEDYHLWFDLLKRGKKVVTIPEVLWLYRTKEKSMIHEAQEHHMELMNQINKDFNIYG